MYAVVATGGRQYLVREGDTIEVDRLAADVGGTVEIAPVLAVGGAEGEAIRIASPGVSGANVAGGEREGGQGHPLARVEAEVVDHHLGDKRITYRYVRTRRYRKIRGSRPSLTTLRIKKISV